MNPPSPFNKVSSPCRWLGQRLNSKKGVSQRAIAQALQRDASQVNRWFSGKEHIPHAMFMAAAVAIDPRHERAAANLWTAHETASTVLDDAHRYLPEFDKSVARRVAADLVDRAEKTALDSVGGDADPESYDALRQYVANVRVLLQLASQCLLRRGRFITPGNVEGHLRFPFNLMGGDLLGRDIQTKVERELLREVLIPDMRHTALSKESGAASIYCRQHAYHMLSRYGSAQDGAFVRELIGHAPDLYTRRTARYGEIINVAEPGAADPFVYELNRDVQLSRVTLEFDFVHYGDKPLNGPGPRGDLRGTVRNYLRRAQQRDAPGQVCLVKLRHILLEFGVGVFQSRTIRPRIESLLMGLYERAPERRTPAERQFLNAFGAHGDFQAARAQQLELL